MQLPQGIMDPLAGHERYQTVEYLGRGASGFVVRAYDRQSNTHVAIKLLKRVSFNKYVESEIINHSMLRHPQVIRFIALFLTGEYICIVMELAAGGNLFDYVRQRGKLSETSCRFMFQQLLMAVDYCHKRGVANRDLKMENTLLQEMPGWPLPLLKLCDFGLSKSDYRSAAKSRVGTPPYMAPEVLLSRGQHQYNGKIADVWSCGVMLFTMLNKKYPFETKSDSAADRVRMLDAMVKSNYHLAEGVSLSPECCQLLGQMLQPNPAQRITVDQILTHPWFLKGLPPGALQQNEQALRSSDDVSIAARMEQIRQMLASVRNTLLHQTVMEPDEDEEAGGFIEELRGQHLTQDLSTYVTGLQVSRLH